jgi:hypothetical protein
VSVRGRPFEAGNKVGRGRLPGSRNKRTRFLEALEKNGLALIQQCQVQALKGDPTSMKLCIERLVPPCKPSGSRFPFPPVQTTEDLTRAFSALVQALAQGKLSAQEGEAISRILENQRRAMEAHEFDARLRALEQPVVDGSSAGEAEGGSA